MKKVLLINPSYPITKTSKKVLRVDPPLALLNLATHLKGRAEVRIVNTAIEPVPYTEIGDYDFIGFTVFIGEFLSNAANIAAVIKTAYPDKPIIFGGVMASIFSEEILRNYPVDYVIRYEGEYTLAELVEGVNPLDIKGLSYKNHSMGGHIVHNAPRYLENDLGNFEIPDWSLFGGKVNHNQVPYYFRIHSSKGCPFQCSFCYSHSADEGIRSHSPRWRARPDWHVIAEMQQLNGMTGAKVFTFGDDNFLVKKDRALKILSAMRDFGWYAEQVIGHHNDFTDGMIDALSGIARTAIYAIESGSPKILKTLTKSINLDKIPETNRKLRDRGITTNHNFIIGFPDETDEDLKMNVDLMRTLKDVNPYVRSVAYLFLPLPKTPLAESISGIPNDFASFEKASFAEGIKFRPWLTPERYRFLLDYNYIFDDLFKANNQNITEKTMDILEHNSRMREIFGNIKTIRTPDRFNPLYILDDVLDGKRPDFRL